jgi:DNA repair exonuclease SbcCD ATPase subunit
MQKKAEEEVKNKKIALETAKAKVVEKQQELIKLDAKVKDLNIAKTKLKALLDSLTARRMKRAVAVPTTCDEMTTMMSNVTELVSTDPAAAIENIDALKTATDNGVECVALQAAATEAVAKADESLETVTLEQTNVKADVKSAEDDARTAQEDVETAVQEEADAKTALENADSAVSEAEDAVEVAEATTVTGNPSVTTAMGVCKPCKEVLDGPLAGVYTLEESNFSMCGDGCLYEMASNYYCFKKDGEYKTTGCENSTTK